MAASSNGSRAVNGAHNRGMSAAAAKIGAHVLSNFVIVRMRISVQQRLRAHNHAGNTVATLRRLLVDEGLLELVWPAVFEQTLKSRDLSFAHRGYRQQAGKRWLPLDVNGAGAALP
jgi:hypothetical protein